MSEETVVATPESAAVDTTEAPSEFDAVPVHTQRDELIEAARAALPGSPDQAKPDDAPAKKDDEPEEAAPESAPAPTLSTIAKFLKQRKDDHRQRTAGDQQRHQFEQERYRFAQEQARFQMDRQQLEAERAKIAETLKDPFKIAEYTGKSHAELARDLAMAGTPEWQLNQRVTAELEQLKAQQASQRQEWLTHQEQLKAHSLQLEQRERASTEQRYVEHTADASKYPNFSKLEPDERLTFGYHTSRKYHTATGEVATDEQIAEYYESRFSTEPGSTRDGSRQQTGANGNAPKTSRATGPRTLSNTAASERRASPRPVKDMTPEELRQALIDEVREVKRTTPA